MNPRFKIKDTRFVEVLISYQMQNRNVLPSEFRHVKISHIFQKMKNQKQWIIQKNPRNKNNFFKLYIYVPNIGSLGTMIYIYIGSVLWYGLHFKFERQAKRKRYYKGQSVNFYIFNFQVCPSLKVERSSFAMHMNVLDSSERLTYEIQLVVQCHQ